jgi:hypothetical protein
MPVINLTTVGPALGHPENVPIDGAATAVAWVGDAPYAYLDGDEVVMPAPLVVRIDDGVPSQPFDIPPDGGQHCWRIEVETWQPGHYLVRYVTVPDVPGSIDFADLADVNRYSFDPEAEPEAAWWTAVNPFITAYNAGELKGDPGAPGPSAYDVAVTNGFIGTEAAWLASLEGADSTVPGPEGPSAYDVAVANGFIGTEAEWLASLEGADSTVPGPAGAPGEVTRIELMRRLGHDEDRERTMRRHDAASVVTNSSGRLTVTTFTAARSRTVSTIRLLGAGAAVGATLIRLGLYAVDAGDDLIALLGWTPSDTARFAAANTAYAKAMSATVDIVAGERYAVGVLFVGTTAPTFGGLVLGAHNINAAPALAGIVLGQTDLPASVAQSTYIATTTAQLYAEVY